MSSCFSLALDLALPFTQIIRIYRSHTVNVLVINTEQQVAFEMKVHKSGSPVACVLRVKERQTQHMICRAFDQHLCSLIWRLIIIQQVQSTVKSHAVITGPNR